MFLQNLVCNKKIINIKFGDNFLEDKFLEVTPFAVIENLYGLLRVNIVEIIWLVKSKPHTRQHNHVTQSWRNEEIALKYTIHPTLTFKRCLSVPDTFKLALTPPDLDTLAQKCTHCTYKVSQPLNKFCFDLFWLLLSTLV